MAKRTRYNKTIKEGDKVICIKDVQLSDTGYKGNIANDFINDRPKSGDVFVLSYDDCMILCGYKTYQFGGLLDFDKPMPSAAWFSNHFSLLT